ncbi:MAG: Xaa-Pro aminopeptidase, partial [bacterium]|nr:Xaa-Pro aminopeptidase [bacterium]
GDLLHCDVGVLYLRLNTDHQELAYVLRPGETDVPEGLKQGMAQANRLQDIFTNAWETGLSGNAILARALKHAHNANINTPRIYSHSLGHFLHEPGPLIGLPWEQEAIPGRGDVTMNLNTCYTVELSADLPVPEWDNQIVRFMLEQDACITETSVTYIDGRQTTFHLI